MRILLRMLQQPHALEIRIRFLLELSPPSPATPRPVVRFEQRELLSAVSDPLWVGGGTGIVFPGISVAEPEGGWPSPLSLVSGEVIGVEDALNDERFKLIDGVGYTVLH